jgi:cell division protease FtsH
VLELLDRETINKDDIAIIFKRVKSWAERPAWTGSITRVPSDIPPVEVPVRAKVVEVAEKKPRTRKKSSE